jgi:hypothetical protein
VFRITLICDGIPSDLGVQAASDVKEEFAHRPWHTNVRCTWGQGMLTLVADNDFDHNGEALADEFSDAVSACIRGTFGYRIRKESVVQLTTPDPDSSV